MGIIIQEYILVNKKRGSDLKSLILKNVVEIEYYKIIPNLRLPSIRLLRHLIGVSSHIMTKHLCFR